MGLGFQSDWLKTHLLGHRLLPQNSLSVLGKDTEKTPAETARGWRARGGWQAFQICQQLFMSFTLLYALICMCGGWRASVLSFQYVAPGIELRSPCWGQAPFPTGLCLWFWIHYFSTVGIAVTATEHFKSGCFSSVPNNAKYIRLYYVK